MQWLRPTVIRLNSILKYQCEGKGLYCKTNMKGECSNNMRFEITISENVLHAICSKKETELDKPGKLLYMSEL